MSKIILFQGDSITDCIRDRSRVDSMGSGYARFVRARIGFQKPGKYLFYNTGIAGNRSIDVYAREKADIINLKPDYLSLLFGVNDVWEEFLHQDGISADKYEKIYRMLIDDVREALPNVQIMIMEPFCLRGTGNDAEPGMWEVFDAEVRKRAERAAKVAADYGIPFIRLQDKFDEMAAKSGKTEHWLNDGVHPSTEGHELIAQEWLKCFEELQRKESYTC